MSVWAIVATLMMGAETSPLPPAMMTWGNNGSGQLGDGTTTNRSSPVAVAGTTWSAIAGGGQHSMALRTTGTLWTWGKNDSGQLGDGTTTNSSSPVAVAGTTWSVLAGGYSHSLALRT